ncbi:MAG TPA: M20/M25/M40 family metallo-hydrolase [Gracilimonas sp.]|uniref:M28 family peptidase n=1 Tax=Gracilimonas sp. TaxID=1974203 RepID=UPI002DA734BB|nr:M20/M25/M40 family metallo-hydrolase [Gracilimonas sp.]
MKKLSILFAAFLFTIAGCTSPEQSSVTVLDTDQLIEDLKVLASDEFEGRRTGTEGNRKAREFLVQRFEEEGATPFQGSFTHEFEFSGSDGETMTGVNVVGEIAGKTDSVIVITAHYDHLGIRDSLIYNGADDDASGTAALLAYIDYFSREQPEHTLVFAAFDAEEMGLRGAREFVEDSVFLDKVVMNINLDMISNNDKNELYASGTYHHPELKPVLEGIETGEISLLFGHDRPDQGYDDWTNASDHAAFHAKGKRFIYFGVEDHEHYHQHTDEFETIPQTFYKNSAEVILNAILAFDAM